MRQWPQQKGSGKSGDLNVHVANGYRSQHAGVARWGSQAEENSLMGWGSKVEELRRHRPDQDKLVSGKEAVRNFKRGEL